MRWRKWEFDHARFTMTRNILFITIDGLAAHALGPYGNTWIPTPAFNALASQSLLLENHITDSITLADVADSWVGNTLLAGDFDSRLITDESIDDIGDVASQFENRISLETTDTRAVTEIEDSAIFHLFVNALAELEDTTSPFFFWIHARGTTGPWTAPYEFRQTFVDDEDPDPPDFIIPPVGEVPLNADPDFFTAISHAYAAEVMQLDVCLDAFLHQTSELNLPGETLLVLTSPRGFPLGDHGVVGFENPPLRSPILHVPLFMRRLHRRETSIRSQALSQPRDLQATFQQWLNGEASDIGDSLLSRFEGVEKTKDRTAFSRSNNEQSWQTPMWRLSVGESGSSLYVKPDDYWEINDVADLCTNEVQELTEEMNRFLTSGIENAS